MPRIFARIKNKVQIFIISKKYRSRPGLVAGGSSQTHEPVSLQVFPDFRSLFLFRQAHYFIIVSRVLPGRLTVGRRALDAKIGVRAPARQHFVATAPQCLRHLRIEKTKSPRRERRGVTLSMNYHVYILECSDESLYVGCTNNLEKRVRQHNESKHGARYTKLRRPVVLMYSEKFETLREARQREREIKGWRREKKLNLINKA